MNNPNLTEELKKTILEHLNEYYEDNDFDAIESFEEATKNGKIDLMYSTCERYTEDGETEEYNTIQLSYDLTLLRYEVYLTEELAATESADIHTLLDDLSTCDWDAFYSYALDLLEENE